MFLNALLVMCGIACGMPLLFVVNSLCRRYVPDHHRNLNERSVELMEERNRLDIAKVEALRELCKAATEA